MKKRLLCLSLIFAMTAAQIVPVSAARKDEVQAEKSATQSKLSAAEAKASSLESKKQALMGQISETQQDLVETIAAIDLLDGEIADKEADIEKTKEDLAKAEADRDEQYEAMKLRIQYMYENGGGDTWAQILLESDSIASMLSKAENTEKMYAYDRDELKKMKEIVQEVKDLENQLEGEKAELETTKNEQEEVKSSLQVKVDNLKASASDYENQIASARAQAQEYKNLIQQQNEELRQIQAQEEAAAKAAQEAAAKAAKAAAAKSTQQSNTAGSTTNNNSGTGNNSNAGTENVTNNTVSENNNTGSVDTGSTGNDNITEDVDTGNSGSVDTTPSEPETSAPSYNSSTGEAVVAYAYQFVGNPYVYGGNSLTNGIDCSGFTQQIFAHFGYSLPRTSDAQAGAGVGISYSESRAGDIIVYPGHVAILTGDGGIVHASNSAPYPQGGIKYTSNALYRSYIAVRRIVQ